MFTGIVEEVGVVRRVTPFGDGVELEIGATVVRDGLALGDSIAHDGVCLTVTALSPGAYRVQAVATTLARTTLGGFGVDRRVNLERALAFGARMGGHLVQGHVDGVGTVRRITREAELTRIELTVPPEVAAVTVRHGSITIDGVSLTVNALPAPDVVELSIIPYTLQHTTLGSAAVGGAVNLEGDVIGKYVRHLLGAPVGGSAERHLRAAWGYASHPLEEEQR